MIIKGITESEEKIIKKILTPYKPNYKFYYYGSRVKGDFSKVSDLDILIAGEKEMPLEDLSIIKSLFDTSDLSYIVNFSDYNSIDSSFYKLIKDDLVNVFIN